MIWKHREWQEMSVKYDMESGEMAKDERQI
jgi:hypothetical protein